MSHDDPHKMRPNALTACGCPRCQDALRLHVQLDALVASSQDTAEALDRLEATIDRLLPASPS